MLIEISTVVKEPINPFLLDICFIFLEKHFHEKFDKLKSIYVKLRDEHVAEIRKVSFLI